MLVEKLKQSGSSFAIAGLRWWIGALLFLATLISYIDRLTLSVLAPVICANLGLSNLEYASIGTWFLLTYSFGQTFFGRLQDRIGTRRGLALAMCIWSIAEIAHAGARRLLSLSLVRMVLGLGEGGHWPAAIKSVAEWFPAEERALAMGIVNTGATLGSALAPPLIVWLQLRFGWQMTFVATGVLGFVWLALWLCIYRQPGEHKWIMPDERRHILAGQTSPDATAANVPWKDLLKMREVQGIVIARFFGDPVWWLYLIWLPLYLYNARGFSLKSIGLFAWIPFVSADAGALLGGWTSGYLVRRGWPLRRARGAAIVFATLLAPVGMFVGRVDSPVGAMALISVVLFAFQFWVNNVQTLPSDLFPSSLVASISGLAGTGAGVGAMIFTLSTGWVVDHLGYTPILIASGLLVPLGTLFLFLLLQPRQARCLPI
jgi:ACS family hexuronate transporter-like MFS transporter